MPESKIKVDKGVPVPTSHQGRPFKYPWLQMEVGDSFFVPGTTARKLGAASAGKRRGTRYVSCTVTEEVDGQPVRGVRVWRVE